jgi:hypothetical protein
MGPEGLLTYSQESENKPQPEPDKCSTHTRTRCVHVFTPHPPYPPCLTTLITLSEVYKLLKLLSSQFFFLQLRPLSEVQYTLQARCSQPLNIWSLMPWRWRQYAPLKHRSTWRTLHGDVSHAVVIFTLAAVRTWNLSHWTMFFLWDERGCFTQVNKTAGKLQFCKLIIRSLDRRCNNKRFGTEW